MRRPELSAGSPRMTTSPWPGPVLSQSPRLADRRSGRNRQLQGSRASLCHSEPARDRDAGHRHPGPARRSRGEAQARRQYRRADFGKRASPRCCAAREHDSELAERVALRTDIPDHAVPRSAVARDRAWCSVGCSRRHRPETQAEIRRVLAKVRTKSADAVAARFLRSAARRSGRWPEAGELNETQARRDCASRAPIDDTVAALVDAVRRCRSMWSID